MRRFLVTALICILGITGFIQAQSGINPFELVNRMDTLELNGQQVNSAVDSSLYNPFEIIKEPKELDIPEEVRIQLAEDQANQLTQFLFLIVLVLVIQLTVLVTGFRIYFRRSYEAFLNDNLLTQYYREREGGGGVPYYLLYIHFFINAGVFIFLIIHHLGGGIKNNLILTLLACIVGVAIIFLGKHLILGILGFIFPISRETKLYSFTIMIFSIIIGIVLVPVNIYLAYGSPEAIPYIIYSSLIGIILIYAFRSLRGLFLANRFLGFHKFHFFLYICAVEIAPALILGKIVYDL